MKTEHIQQVIDRLRAVGKDEALLAEVWAELDDFEVSVFTEREQFDALRKNLGEGGVRAVVLLYVVFHRRVLDEPLT
ncbi:MAG TPA: hypothetical protein VJ731_01225 [Terriglobales bacterium]|nr:hypothetical protein [Terriglobales bacterium]